MLRDGLIYIPAKALPSVFGFVTSMALTWLLSPAEYGTYGLGLAIVTMASNVFFDWLIISFLRFYQGQRGSRAFFFTFGLLFATGCACTALILGLVLAADLAGSYAPLLLVAMLNVWCYAGFEFTSRIQVAEFRPVRYLRMNLVRNVAIMVLGVAVAWLTRSALAVLAASALCMLAAACLYRLPISAGNTAAFDQRLARSVLRFGLPVLATMSLYSLYFSFGRVMLEWLAGSEAVGFFTVGLMLVQNTVGMLAASVDAATYSVCVRAAESSDRVLLRRQLEQSWTLLLGITLPASVGLALVTPGLAQLMVGPTFVAAVNEVTPFIALSALFAALRANYFERGLQLGHRTGAQLRVMAGAAAITIGLNFLLIPLYGHVGAGVALAIAAVTSFVHAAMSAKRSYPMPVPLAVTLKITAATAAMAIAVSAVPIENGPLTLALQVAAGALVYAAVLVTTDVLGARTVILRWAAR